VSATAARRPGPALGTMASVEGARVDFTRLRADRRRRLLEAMAAAGLDALVLGRPANALYASGARQLWTAGARPFGPGCVVVAATGRVHLLSTWDEGVPPELDHDELYGITWNPARVAASLRAIPGLAGAKRVGTDGLSPGFVPFLRGVAPDAVVVDGGPALRAARTVKTPDELACLATAVAVAEAALSALVEALHPGVTERQLLGRYAERVAELGTPTPPSDAVVCATPSSGPVTRHHQAGDRPIDPGQLVVLEPGALFAGYEGGIGRTWLVGAEPTSAQRALASRSRAAVDAVVAACRAGATGEALLSAATSTGETLGVGPVAYGLGLGVEAPLVAAGFGGATVLAAGTVLAVQAWVAEAGVGGFFEREVVVVGDDGPCRLSRYGHGPAGTR